jgi:glutamine amidotransferase
MLTIIDYKAGNVRSIQNMLKKIGVKSLISGKPEDVQAAEKLILPGVGHFDYGMEQLEKSGLIPVLNRKVMEEKIPILGICLGVQLFTKSSEEGSRAGLGWLNARTVAFDKNRLPEHCKIPHMGWNQVSYNPKSPIFANMPEDARFYFVHSFHLVGENPDDIVVEAEYGYKFTAGFEHENIIGLQFHPEKSHKFGMQVLRNFVENY